MKRLKSEKYSHCMYFFPWKDKNRTEITHLNDFSRQQSSAPVRRTEEWPCWQGQGRARARIHHPVPHSPGPLDLSLFHYRWYSFRFIWSDFVTTRDMSLHIPHWKAFVPSFSSISWVLLPWIRSIELITQMTEHLLIFYKETRRSIRKKTYKLSAKNKCWRCWAPFTES